MNKIKYIFVILGMFLLAGCCNNADSKSDTWTEEQKAIWTQNCLKMLEANQDFEGVAEDVCDCMLNKTAETYTPEEAASITREEELKIWEKCDYSW